MDDDDYFADEIFLDEQTLAVLDHEEQKYLTQAITTTPPPFKRQKTASGWKAGTGKRTASVSEQLPEITLVLDGSYGITQNAGLTKPPMVVPKVLVPPALPPQVVSHYTPSQLVSRNSTSVQHQTNVRLPQGPTHGFQRTITQSILVPPAKLCSTLQPAYDNHHPLEIQLEELQRKFEQVNEENKHIQTALREACDLRLSREGEVAVLRKNAEKAAKEYAAQLAKLKAAREEVEAKQTRMQKEMREEVERLKTQFVFKQQEQESTRKPPPSIRPKKIYKEPSFTWISPPSHSKHRNGHAIVREHFEPSPANDKEIQQSPKVKKTTVLPGFQNTFDQNAPICPSKNRPDVRKQANTLIAATSGEPSFHQQRPYSTRAPSMDNPMFALLEGTPMQSAHIQGQDQDEDIDMSFEAAEDVMVAVDVDEEYSVGPPRWKGELNRILLMHFYPLGNALTIQMLLGAPIIPASDDDLSDIYFGACTRVLEVLANASNVEEDWRYSVECVATSLIFMVPTLKASKLFLALAALLNLLSILIYSLPGLGSFILSQPFDTQTSDCRILVYIHSICLDQHEMEKPSTHEALETEIVTLLEALSFTVDPESVDKLAYILNNRQVLMTLFHGNQSSWLLARSARLLVILASHRQLCRFLLLMPNHGLSVEKTSDVQKIPLIERLCLYLMDADRKDADCKDAKISVLTFFALLSNSQPDVHAHLVTSTTVIPSLVVFLSQLTASFWEDDEDLLFATSEEVSLTIHTLNQALFLLHHLVFNSVLFLNLRQKLHAPHHRLFHGLSHLFIVTFGRLSYGEAPEWINRQGRINLVSSTDMARDILDHVVDGPEADRTWQAFQVETEKSDDLDEEEMEVQLLGERI